MSTYGSPSPSPAGVFDRDDPDVLLRVLRLELSSLDAPCGVFG